MTCSVLILTRDEEQNIAACIESARFSDDVVVFDSESTDRTRELAEAAGARVFVHRFENYGRQREAARTLVDYRNEWVLALDADERVDAELAAELPRVLATAPESVAAYRLRRKDTFRGRWIRRASLYPSWHLRVFRNARVAYPERSVHEYPTVDGAVGELRGHLLHDNFSKGLGQWWQRHLRYAELEAAEIVAARQTPGSPVVAMLTRDPVERRRALKALSYRLPFRPTLRYLYMMLLRGAVLDGPAGWEYCRMIATYQQITDQLVREAERRT